jgi:hypothetical protein
MKKFWFLLAMVLAGFVGVVADIAYDGNAYGKMSIFLSVAAGIGLSTLAEIIFYQRKMFGRGR